MFDIPRLLATEALRTLNITNSCGSVLVPVFARHHSQCVVFDTIRGFSASIYDTHYVCDYVVCGTETDIHTISTGMGESMIQERTWA